MGLFDAYDPQTYQGAQGGLLDRLRQRLDEQSQYQPAQGFPQSPMNAQASAPAPQPQNDPIAVGNYQMPRIGSGWSMPQIHPDTGETIPQQPPAVIPAQQSAPLPQQLQAPTENTFGDHLAAGAHNLLGGGSLANAFVGGIAGLITGHRTDPQAVQQENMRMQLQALINAGVPREKAVLAVINPEFAKTIIPQAFGPHPAENLGQGWVRDPQTGAVTRAYKPEQNDNFVVVQTGEDGMGNKTFSQMNKATGERTPIAPPPGADTGNGGIGDTTKTGAEYLATLPPNVRGTVLAVAEGRQAAPTGFAAAKPYWSKTIIPAVQQYDSSFDATNWGGRVAGVKDFSSGKSSEMVRSANQTIGHIGDLIGKMDALNNGDYPLLNKAGNLISSNTGGAAVTGFQQTAHAVADELSKVFKGAGISDHEIRQWEENLSPNMSPAQQHEAVTTAMSLLQHSLSALEEKRLNSIGPMAAEKAGPLLKPDAQAAIKRIQKWAAGKADEAAAPIAPLDIGQSATIGKVTITKVSH